MFYVYSIFNIIDAKMYIGKTNNPKRRWARHLKNAKKSNLFLYRAMRKHGIYNFLFTIFQEFVSETDCTNAEMYWIKFFDSRKNGYNLTDGGEGCCGRIISEETRDKMRRSATGRKLSDETKEKLRQINLGKIPTNIEQLKVMNIGKHLSEDHKKKISEARVGIVFNEEHKKNIKIAQLKIDRNGENNPFYGRTHTEEIKNNSRGENNKKSKLTVIEVLEIRQKYATGNYTHQELADMYNITRWNVTHILNRRTWNHI